MKKIIIQVEKTKTGFSAYAEDYNAFTTGRNSAELTANMVESLNLYLEDKKPNKTISVQDLSFQIKISSVFDVFPINIKALAERIGMNYTLLSQYASGKKNPSTKQTKKIITGIHEIGRELTAVNLI